MVDLKEHQGGPKRNSRRTSDSQIGPKRDSRRPSGSQTGPRPKNTIGPSPGRINAEREAASSHPPPTAANEIEGQKSQELDEDKLPVQTVLRSDGDTQAAVASGELVRTFQEALENAENELQHSNSQLKETRKRWKQAAVELNELRSQSQGFHQVTDDFLIGLVQRLRFDIRSFTIEYFESGITLDMFNTNFFWKEYLNETNPTLDTLIPHLPPAACPSIIQAYIWGVFVGQLFDAFRWAGDSAMHIRELCLKLRPRWQVSPDSNVPSNPEAERRFQVWSATTTGLILDAMHRDVESESQPLGNTSQFPSEKVFDFKALKLNPGLSQNDFMNSWERIIAVAVALDKEISRQVARMKWVFPPIDTRWLSFDPTVMELAKGEKHTTHQEVALIVAPGLKKRGKSTGSDFDIEDWLLPMEVSCRQLTG